MMTTEKIVEEIYQSYGTDSGCLFGLNPNQRIIVLAIVKVVQRIIEQCGEPNEQTTNII